MHRNFHEINRKGQTDRFDVSENGLIIKSNNTITTNLIPVSISFIPYLLEMGRELIHGTILERDSLHKICRENDYFFY